MLKIKRFSHSSRQKKTGAVGGSIVGEPDLDTVSGELVGVRRLHNAISLKSGVRYLATNVLVAGPDNHTILGSIVLVFVLDHKALPSKVIGLAFPTPAELDLEPLKVRLVLHDLHENL